jgi:hypothetical protein
MNNITSGTGYGPQVAGWLFLSKAINITVHFLSVRMVVGTPQGGFQCADLRRDWNTPYRRYEFSSLYTSTGEITLFGERAAPAAHLKMSRLSYSCRQACHSRKHKIAMAIYLSLNLFSLKFATILFVLHKNPDSTLKIQNCRCVKNSWLLKC